MTFNKRHSVGQVMQKITLTDELQKMKPNEMDLRFFSAIHFGDTFDGYPNPANGMRYRGIFYGNQIVFAFKKMYHEGSGHGSQSEGSALFSHMYDVAMAYLEVQKIGGRQYWREPLPSRMTREKRKEVNRVLIDPDVLQTLKKHPQYRDLAASMGLKLVRVEKTSYITVKASKHG